MRVGPCAPAALAFVALAVMTAPCGARGAAAPVPAGALPKVEDLPLVEVPAKGATGDVLAVMVTGDGGWSGLDRRIGEILASRGIPVVGLNSLRYFWKARTPEEASRALEAVLRAYLPAWGKDQAVLIGYSLGADVLPSMANRLPSELRAKTRAVVLLGPATLAEFHFHVSEWLGAKPGPEALPVGPEVEQLRGTPVLCLYGEDEKESLCPTLLPDLARSVRLPGGHHFGGDYDGIAAKILQEVSDRPPAS